MKENVSTARCWYYYRGATGEGGGACQHKMLVPLRKPKAIPVPPLKKT